MDTRLRLIRWWLAVSSAFLLIPSPAMGFTITINGFTPTGDPSSLTTSALCC